MTASNEILWIAMLAANFLAIAAAQRLLGKTGLLIWIAVATITANVQVAKTVELFGLTATLGNIVYAGSFLATDILNEVYGEREARRGVLVGFVSIIAFTILMNVALLFKPSAGDFAQPHLVALFSLLPRIALASLVAYGVSQIHDVWAYAFWKRRFPRHLWLRNNLSTAVSQLLDSAIFTVAAFAGVFPGTIVVEIVITTYLFKLVVAVVDTPFLYLGRQIGRRENDTTG